MLEKIKAQWAKLKEYWAKQPKKKKNTIIGACCGGLVGVVLVALLIQGAVTGGYVVLYPGIDSTESAEVFATLNERGVEAKINNNGEVTVPSEMKNALLLDLAGSFPRTAPNYGIYTTYAGFTATESDRRVYLNAQTQDRLQDTLGTFTSIRSAIVTIVTPEESNRIWEQTDERSSASVTLTMVQGKTLTAEQVTSIKNLVAYSIPKCDPADVRVIDTAKGIELESTLDLEIDSLSALKRADYERQYENNLVRKVESLLSSIYGYDGVRAVATVSFDYDRMLTEEMEYIPGDDGRGVLEHLEDRYTVGGNAIAEGIPGEDGNTDDFPNYENQNPDADGGYTDIYRDMDWRISYIKRQIEKGDAILKDASISVMVRDNDLTTERQNILLDSISKAVNIPIDKIALTNTWLTTADDIPAQSGSIIETLLANPILLGAIVLITLLLIIGIVLLLRSRSKKKKKGKAAVASTAPTITPEEAEAKLRAEIEEQKRLIRESYGGNALDKENIISNEVRDFANQNPEITATLIRAWLKEDE